tara:strand:+ start:1466 stop:1717 length:252 start_codon:yes stop_codon:yes gene_type:complete
MGVSRRRVAFFTRRRSGVQISHRPRRRKYSFYIDKVKATSVAFALSITYPKNVNRGQIIGIQTGIQPKRAERTIVSGANKEEL